MNMTFTKDEAVNLRLAVQDINLFLRLAALRIENHPDKLPFKPVNGQHVITWLRALADRYGNGEDISTVA
jgi:hypothetical protein